MDDKRGACAVVCGAGVGILAVVCTWAVLEFLEIAARPPYESVVVIEQGSTAGTGFIVGPGLVMTAGHVVAEDGGPITVSGQSGTLRARDRELDLALVDVPGLSHLPSLAFRAAREGEEVRLVGYTPWEDRFELLVHRGWVANVDFGSAHYVLVGGAGRPGMSGGPLLDAGGASPVLGVLVRITSLRGGLPNPTQVLFVPAVQAQSFLADRS